jgi:hypothetical protein
MRYGWWGNKEKPFTKERKMKRIFETITLAVMTLALIGCGGGSGGGSGAGTGSVSLSSVTTDSSTKASYKAGGGSDASLKTLTDGSTTIVITRARVLLREIEFEIDDDDLIEDLFEYETPAMVVELDLNGTLTNITASNVPANTYDEIEFEIHRIDPLDADDAAAIAAAPAGTFDDFLAGDRYSIIIDGTVDVGSGPIAFTFQSRDEAEQEIELTAPLVVTAGGSVNVTLTSDMNLWFRTQDLSGNPDPAGALLDPRNVVNESTISDNIAKSYDGFEDDDEDGEED